MTTATKAQLDLIYSNTAASNESRNIGAFNLGHCGAHASCMQAQVSDTVSRIQTLRKRPVQRGYSKPTPWPSK
ncbi:hypothetical protein [Pseudomonas sp. W5-01]|uniref:hypothetical protein n=1 Tax=Pseudomonas sp. W5-01 TaxID=3097454 RepID=UPI00397B6D70